MSFIAHLAATAQRACGFAADDGMSCWDGDCALLAIALNRFLGGSDTDHTYVAVYNSDSERTANGEIPFSHVVLSRRGLLIDGNGITSVAAMRDFAAGDHGTVHLKHRLGVNEVVRRTAARFLGEIAVADRLDQLDAIIHRAWETTA